MIPPPRRRRGYATEAARLLLRYAFDEQRYQKCNSACVEGNVASIALHERLGFAEEGRVSTTSCTASRERNSTPASERRMGSHDASWLWRRGAHARHPRAP
jgi:RimJ/RimL family protein N-acetyltransferase